MKNNFQLIGIALLISLVVGAYYLGANNTAITTTTISLAGNSQSSKTAVFNFNQGDSRAQISAPGSYFATDYTMITSYDSQGGMAPPDIILMKNYQINGNTTRDEADYYAAIHESKNDCIVIWSTGGFGSIDDWNNTVTSLKGELTEKQEITVGTRKVQMYKMLKKEGDIYVALLQFGNEANTSYYFHTCNANNKSDFVNVIQSIKFREDVKF